MAALASLNVVLPVTIVAHELNSFPSCLPKFNLGVRVTAAKYSEESSGFIVRRNLKYQRSTAQFSRIREGNSTQGMASGICETLPRAALQDAGLAPAEPAQLEVAESDLLVIGPGVLGSLVAQQWLEAFPDNKVVGQTRTPDRHQELRELGILPFVRGSEEAEALPKFPYVIFCAPPSGSEDYPGEVRAAAQRWDGTGALLFTSSSAVYDVNDNGMCGEDAPLLPLGKSPRADRLLKAESEVIAVGGTVVRLAGLYHGGRGAHTYWLSLGRVEARPDHVLNLIHYEDAASLCVTALRAKARGKIFMGCDNHPVSRQEVIDIALRSGKFQDSFGGFTESGGPLGKRMNNDTTRALLSWQPKHTSFASHLGVA